MEIKGTVFCNRHHSPEIILECLAWLAERNSLAAIHRVKEIKEETVLDWLRGAARHVEQIEALLLAHYHLTHAQLDALWTYAGHKGAKGGHPEEDERGTFRSQSGEEVVTGNKYQLEK